MGRKIWLRGNRKEVISVDPNLLPFVEKVNVRTKNHTKSLDILGLRKRPHRTRGKLKHKEGP